MQLTLPILALVGLAHAHFQLQWPPISGPFNEDDEGTSPCGGQVPNVNSTSTKINVSQFSVAIRNSHPTGTWQFYVSLNTAPPYQFSEITEGIKSTGLGTFCSTGLYAPSSYAGKQGILQVISDSSHGSLYLCAPVNFVSSDGDSPGNTCTNSSSASITWASSGNRNISLTTTYSSSPSSTSAAGTVASTNAGSLVASVATSSTRTGAAPTMTMGGVIAGIGMVAAGLLI